jgi:multicomponent Na+:H+ antiporter subunit D
VSVSLLVSLLTLFSMVKIWSGAFWSPALEAPEGRAHEPGRIGGPALMVAPTAALVAVSLAIAFAAGPLYDLSERAAGDLLDPVAYVREVLGG